MTQAEWHKLCISQICPECGERKVVRCAGCAHPLTEPYEQCTECPGLGVSICCTAPAWHHQLVALLRRLAGINPAQANQAVVHDEDKWFAGPAGMRTCGPGAWENTVAAYEEVWEGLRV